MTVTEEKGGGGRGGKGEGGGGKGVGMRGREGLFSFLLFRTLR